MSDEIKKKKTVSFSQFSTWFTCPHRWYRDYLLHEKEFEDNLIMSFGTSIHETIQLYLKTLYNKEEKRAEAIDMMKYFIWAFKRQISKKKIPHTQIEFDEFVEDGRNILTEFRDPANRLRHFPKDKWELLGIEEELRVGVMNNLELDAFLDIVLREKISGNIRIIDVKTSTRGWNSYTKEDFAKTSQLILYKALYSKKFNIPLSKIHVEFFILKRKLYDESTTPYEQSRLQIFKPSAFQKDVNQVIGEFSKFINTCFTPTGEYITDALYPKIPGKNRKNCKYCQYLKNKKCDGIADKI